MRTEKGEKIEKALCGKCLLHKSFKKKKGLNPKGNRQGVQLSYRNLPKRQLEFGIVYKFEFFSTMQHG